MVKTEGLSKVYRAGRGATDTVAVLSGVSLTVEPGIVLGLIGANGAGKTTLLSLLAGLLRPTSGSVSIGGLPPWSREIKGRLGLLPERPSLLGCYTGMATLLYHAALAKVERKKARQRAAWLLERLDLKAAERQPCATFSLGMKQRLGLAVALIHDPGVLLLDEPGNGLDPCGIVELRGIIKELAHEGKTVIVSSHHLAEVEAMASRVLLLRNGRATEIDTRPTPERAWSLHVRLGEEASRWEACVVGDVPVSRVSGRLLVFSLTSEDTVPEIIACLVHRQARIMSVSLERIDLETRFMAMQSEEA